MNKFRLKKIVFVEFYVVVLFHFNYILNLFIFSSIGDNKHTPAPHTSGPL